MDVMRVFLPVVLYLPISHTSYFNASSKFASMNITYGINENPTTTPIILSGKKTLKELCAMFSYRCKTSCMCECLPKRVCELHQKFKKNETVLVDVFGCNKLNDVIEASFATVTFLIASIGNGLVITITLKNRERYTHCQHVIGTLAFSDLLYCVSSIIIRLPLFWTCRWVYGIPMCKGLHAISNFFDQIGVGFIVIISIERYFGIVKSFSRGLTFSRLFLLAVTNVVFTAFSVLPLLFVLSLSEHGLCHEEWPIKDGALIYSWFLSVSYFVFPMLAILFMYLRIMKKLRDSIHNNYSLTDRTYRSKRQYENKRVMRILTCVVVCFFLFVFPNRLVWLIMNHFEIQNLSRDVYNGLKLVIFIPYHFHVMINPIIYAVVDQKFRSEVRKLFPCQKTFAQNNTQWTPPTMRMDLKMSIAERQVGNTASQQCVANANV